MNIPIRSEVLNFAAYVPGLSMAEIRTKYNLAQVIKLASNENPLGTSSMVQAALCQTADLAFRYPAAHNPRLTQALSQVHGIKAERLIIGNGSDEIIDLLLRTCPQDHEVMVCNPCFNIYTTQAKLCGLTLQQVPLKSDFSFDFKAMLAAITPKTAIIFLTSPDNPSGYAASASELADFASKIPSYCLLVIDEAYIHFTPKENDYSLIDRLADFPQIAILRTFSKAYGLAGLRLGYGIFPAPLAQLLRNIRLPFSVNILAEEAGLAALEDLNFLAQTKAVVQKGRGYLQEKLTSLGCKVYPSQANFIMFQPPKTPQTSSLDSSNAQDIFEQLLKQGIIIRPLKSYQLPDYLRVSIGTMEENALFIQALTTILSPNNHE